MKTYEEYCLELKHQIDSCRNGNTDYTESYLKKMYENGLFLIKKILKEPGIKFNSLFIGHNTFQIRFEGSYEQKGKIERLLKDWQSDKDEYNNPKEKIISRFFSNGYGTAYVIPYD